MTSFITTHGGFRNGENLSGKQLWDDRHLPRSMSSSTNIKKTGLKPGRKEKKELPPLEERLRRLYKSLSSQIDGGHLGNAGKTCDKRKFSQRCVLQ